jgi:GT2 family glycosyltransferase
MSIDPDIESPGARIEPALAGTVERFENCTLIGWVSDGTEEPVKLDIFIDADFYRTVRADGPRADVIKAGFAVTGSGFAVAIPRAKLTGHSLLRVYDNRLGREVPGSPIAIEPAADDDAAMSAGHSTTASVFEDVGVRLVDALEKEQSVPAATKSAARPRKVSGRVEGFDGKILSGWVTDGTDDYTTVKILLNGELYAELEGDLPRQDVVDAGFTSINCGFVLQIPFVYLATNCTVRVIDSLSERDIHGSPLLIEPSAVAIPTDVPDIGILSDLVINLTERTADVVTLQANASFIMNWLQRTVDRATALRDARALRFENLNHAVAENGGLSGTLGHFYGLLQTQYPQIVLARHQKPKVSIVIPVHNKFELTYNCISSINDALTNVTFDIVVVDDASSDETLLSPLMFQGGCQVVRTLRNEGFIGACNLGASRASGEYVLFLNNDTIVNDGWLDALSETLDDDPSIGVVGSRLLFADGVLQEVGGIIWRDASAWNWGRGQDKSHPTYSFMRDADYVSGASLMIRRALFEQLGGFDDFYAPAYYEDTDLCFRVRQAGLRVVVQPRSTIIHLEGQSNGTSTTAGLKRYQLGNAKKFRSRWVKVLAKHRLNGQDPVKEAERGVQRRALFIDDSTPTPDKDAGSNAALQHMQSLQRLGYKVVFLPADNMAEIPVYTAALQGLGIECWYAPFAWSVEEYFRRSERNFDVVYIHRRANAQRYLGLVRKYVPGAKILFNYADIHALRDIREAELASAPPLRIAQLRRELESELDIANEVYSVIVHSTFEANFIRMNRPDADVHYVPWTVNTTADRTTLGDRTGIVFIGGYGHPPNVDAVEWMMETVWPLISRRKLGHNFRIVGSNMPDRFKDYLGPDVEPVGHVSDLDDLLDGTALTVAPLRYGAGLKGKVLSSLARGVPCVMSSIAAEGLELPPELQHLVQDDRAGFVSEVTSLLTDEAKWVRTSQIGLSFIRDNFASDIIDGLIKDAIRGGRPKIFNEGDYG